MAAIFKVPKPWYAPAWFARVEYERGVAADMRFFELLAAINNTLGGTPADPDGSSATTLSTGRCRRLSTS